MDVALMPADHSMVGLFLQADIIVKSVMVFLVLASVACWAVILDKALRYARARRQCPGRLAAGRRRHPRRP
jgi:biopolymer transport protein ExbB/TolQ